MTAGNTPTSGERAWPQVWIRVSRYGHQDRRAFTRETEKMLFYRDNRGNERRESKADIYGAWYPTQEEADAVSAAARQRHAEQEALKLKRAAAADLFEALETARDYVGDVAAGRASELTKLSIVEMAKGDLARIDAALAKATGQQP